MPKKTAPEPNLTLLVEDFVKQIVSAVEAATAQRVQSAVLTALAGGGGLPRRRGRPPKNPPLLGSSLFQPARKRPKQLCPVPGCTNPAAPVFGMVCAKHKDVPKAQIKKYRAERKASKGKEKERAAKAA